MRIFIDEQPTDIEPGTTTLDAIRQVDPGLGQSVAAGDAHVTDGVGRSLPPEAVLEPGAILRVIRSPLRKPADD